MSKRHRYLVALLAAALLLVPVACRKQAATGFEYGTVTRGDITNIVSSTGTMEPVGKVEVGTQVSGSVERVLVDFNDPVTPGQLLAVLDTAPLAAQLRDAEAGLARARAQNVQSEAETSRKQELFDLGLISESELEAATTGAVSSRASLLSAEAALERARTNLGYAFIRSPIAGMVLHRNVEPGQTVAASFSTPTLFIIVEDMAKMRILALVDESDIGQVDSGLPVKFTVQAFPEREFSGTVSQVRFQPQTTSNVVSYTVVVDAANDDGVLLPGMTATVDFYVEQREQVLTVPSAALGLSPTQEMLDELRKLREAQQPETTGRRARPDSLAGRTGPRPEAAADVSRLWCLDEQGRLAVVMVRAGATDGRNTEVIPVRGELREGTKVVVKASGTAVRSGRAPGGPPPGMGGGMFGPGR